MKLFDSRIGTKRDFTPLGEEVKMYVCGPNLYGPCHVGHALSFVFFDVLRRYLEYSGYRVLHVQNFTDIEDRIIQEANSQGRVIGDLAEYYIQRFLKEMDQLNIQRAHYYPRATENIEHMVKIIETLIDKGYAYEIEGDVYFRVRSFSNYGQLSRRSLDDMQAGSRIEVDLRKEDPMDFTLWKSSSENEPSWQTNWGKGRPGWHIECTAMSLGLLGDQLDIHGGGQDVVFPHHENEIAQSEAYTDKSPFVRFWVHNGLLRSTEKEEEKMTRHVGNFVSCHDVLERHYPDTIRLFLLSSHYRSPRAYSEEELIAQERAIERIRIALQPSSALQQGDFQLETYKQRFNQAMDNDLNTPEALAVLFDLAREINRQREIDKEVSDAQAVLKELGQVLGLTFDERVSRNMIGAEPFIKLLVEIRSELRETSQYTIADKIRTDLTGMGVVVEDGSDGATWRFKRREDP